MKLVIFISIFIIPFNLKSQVKSGPWVGNIGLRTASVWIEPDTSIYNIQLWYYPSGKPGKKEIKQSLVQKGKEFNPVKIHLG